MNNNIKTKIKIGIIMLTTIISIFSLVDIKGIKASTVSGEKEIAVSNSGRNLSAGKLNFTKNISLAKGDVVEFAIVVKALNKDLKDVSIKDILPSTLTYVKQSTRINNVKQTDTLTSKGLNIGNLNKGESKTIYFKAYTKQIPKTILTSTNEVEAWADGERVVYDTTTLNYSLVYGASTVQTGMKGSIFFPLILSLLSSLTLWAYLTFNPKGKLVLVSSKTKLRNLSWKLSYLRYRLFK